MVIRTERETNEISENSVECFDDSYSRFTGEPLQEIAAGASSFAPCAATSLAPKVGRGGAATGTSYETLLIKNRSLRSCTLSGMPTTQFGNFVKSGSRLLFKAVGPTSVKEIIVGRGRTILLKSGSIASVTIGIETADNFPTSKCVKANFSRVRIVSKGQTTFYYTFPINSVCTKLVSTSTSGVVLGTRFP